MNSFRSILTCICIGLLFVTSVTVNGQGDYRYRFDLSTIKNEDGTRSLVTSFYGRKDRQNTPVYGADIAFYNVLGDSVTELGIAKTTQEGLANIILPGDIELLVDEDGFITFLARFTGTDGIDEQEAEVSVMDVLIEMEFEKNEEGYTLNTSAVAVDGSGGTIPVTDVDIYYYIQGMITRLKLEDGWLDEGEYSFEFPNDLPGDESGNLIVFAAIEDSDEYGNVIIRDEIDWGTGRRESEVKNYALWSDAAPIWMNVVLGLFLLGVWINYIYTIINLFKLKRDN